MTCRLTWPNVSTLHFINNLSSFRVVYLGETWSFALDARLGSGFGWDITGMVRNRVANNMCNTVLATASWLSYLPGHPGRLVCMARIYGYFSLGNVFLIIVNFTEYRIYWFIKVSLLYMQVKHIYNKRHIHPQHETTLYELWETIKTIFKTKSLFKTYVQFIHFSSSLCR